MNAKLVIALVEHAHAHANLTILPSDVDSHKPPTVVASLPTYRPPTIVSHRGDFPEWLRGEAATHLVDVPTDEELAAVQQILAYWARKKLQEDALPAREGA